MYVVTEASKYVIAVSIILVTSSLAAGLWLISVPSAKGSAHVIVVASLSPSHLAVQMPKIFPDQFRVCTLTTGPAAYGFVYGSLVTLAGIYF